VVPLGMLNIAAQSTVRHNQQFGTINSSAQSPFWLNIAAESALWRNQPFGTFIISAQLTVWHNEQFGTIIIAHIAESILTHHYTTE